MEEGALSVFVLMCLVLVVWSGLVLDVVGGGEEKACCKLAKRGNWTFQALGVVSLSD